MFPYNDCEFKWLSKTKESVKKHYEKNRTLYIGYAYIMLMSALVLAFIVSLKSFA